MNRDGAMDEGTAEGVVVGDRGSARDSARDSFLARTAKNALIYQAAEAMANWITHFQYPDGRKGLTVEDLVELVRGQEPVLKPILSALSVSPGFNPDMIRSAKPLIARFNENDYWQMLRHDVLHAACHEHALALAHPDVWPDFCRQMDLARDMLLAL